MAAPSYKSINEATTLTLQQAAQPSPPPRRYTLTHLVCAILGTFLLTAILLPKLGPARKALLQPSRPYHTPPSAARRPSLSTKVRSSAQAFIDSLEQVNRYDARVKADKVVLFVNDEDLGDLWGEAVTLARELEKVANQIRAEGIPIYKMNTEKSNNMWFLEVVTGANDLYVPAVVFLRSGSRGRDINQSYYPGPLDWRKAFNEIS